MWSSLKASLTLSSVIIFETLLKVKVKSLSRVGPGFSRQEYWSGLPFPSPGDPPNPGMEPGSPTLEADALTSEHQGSPETFLPLL